MKRLVSSPFLLSLLNPFCLYCRRFHVSRRPNSRAVWQGLEPCGVFFCGYSGRERRGDNNNIAPLPLTTLFSLLRSGETPVLFPPQSHQDTAPKLTHGASVRFYLARINIKTTLLRRLTPGNHYLHTFWAESHRPFFSRKGFGSHCSKGLSPRVQPSCRFFVVFFKLLSGLLWKLILICLLLHSGWLCTSTSICCT